jgi:hypothetical protein
MNEPENQQRVERAVALIHAELEALNTALGPVPPTSSPQRS